MDANLGHYVEFARELTLEAGQMSLDYFRAGVKAERKTDGSPVAVVDHERSEKISRTRSETRRATAG